MAKKNVRDEPPKTQVTENAQLSDIVFILDKMELLYRQYPTSTRTAGTRRFRQTKSLLELFPKIDRYASMFENFPKNFWSQLKDPTRFGIAFRQGECAGQLRKSDQAIEDLAAGKKIRTRWSEFLRNTRLFPAQKKPKYNSSKSRRNGKKLRHSNRPLRNRAAAEIPLQ